MLKPLNYWAETIAPSEPAPQSSPYSAHHSANTMGHKLQLIQTIEQPLCRARSTLTTIAHWNFSANLPMTAPQTPLRPCRSRNRPKTSPLVKSNWKSNLHQTFPNIPFCFPDDSETEWGHLQVSFSDSLFLLQRSQEPAKWDTLPS